MMCRPPEAAQEAHSEASALRSHPVNHESSADTLTPERSALEHTSRQPLRVPHAAYDEIDDPVSPERCP